MCRGAVQRKARPKWLCDTDLLPRTVGRPRREAAKWLLPWSRTRRAGDFYADVAPVAMSVPRRTRCDLDCPPVIMPSGTTYKGAYPPPAPEPRMKSRILLQVTAPALLTGLILIGTSLGSAWSIHRLQSNLASILSENVSSVQASNDLENRMRQLRYHSFLYMVQPDDSLLSQIELDERNFQDAFARAEDAGNTPDEAGYLRKIAAGYDQYQREMARLRGVVARQGPFKDLSQLNQVHPIRHVVTPCQELGQLNLEQLDETVRESDQLGARTRAVLLFLGLAGPV